MGKSTINGPFSIAMLNNQRVKYHELSAKIIHNGGGNHLPSKNTVISTLSSPSYSRLWPIFDDYGK
jgi:hypothetical protein